MTAAPAIATPVSRSPSVDSLRSADELKKRCRGQRLRRSALTSASASEAEEIVTMDNADVDSLILAMSTVTRAYVVDAHERQLVSNRFTEHMRSRAHNPASPQYRNPSSSLTSASILWTKVVCGKIYRASIA